jgi:osmotically-inducible protein OsmY
MHAMVSLARAEPKAAKDDATIRQKLLAELNKEKWALASMINVVVCHGVVELWGAIVDERQREALKVAAENVPGVKRGERPLSVGRTGLGSNHCAERRGCDGLARIRWELL